MNYDSMSVHDLLCEALALQERERLMGDREPFTEAMQAEIETAIGKAVMRDEIVHCGECAFSTPYPDKHMVECPFWYDDRPIDGFCSLGALHAPTEPEVKQSSSELGIMDVKLHDRIKWQVGGQIVTGTVVIIWGDCFGVVPDGTTRRMTITFDMFCGFEVKPNQRIKKLH